MSKIQGRAETDEEKRIVLARLLEVWKKTPHARLGQLLLGNSTEVELYFVEDETLVEKLEMQVKARST